MKKEVKEEAKKEVVPERVKQAHEALIAQINQFAKDESKAATMKVKAMGALEVIAQMYPELQEDKSDS